jgi:hypothetical protein
MKETNISDTGVLRIIDANLNRLREALRIVEEHFRFIDLQQPIAVSLKKLRHALQTIEESFGTNELLAARDVATDPFASVNRPEEMTRATIAAVLVANFKRAQEAARVIEEYAKVANKPDASEIAKIIRFSMYTLEKDTAGL